MKVIKAKLEVIRIKSFVTVIEEEQTLIMKGGSSHDTLFKHCEDMYPFPFRHGQTFQIP
jgi:hypothetical protein